MENQLIQSSNSKSVTPYKKIIIINVVVLLVLVSINGLYLMNLPKTTKINSNQSPSPQPTSASTTTGQAAIGYWSTYSDTQSFDYPTSWGALMLTKSNGNNYYYSTSSNLIPLIIYNQESGTIAYVEKSAKEYPVLFREGKMDRQDSLKVILKDKTIKILYEPQPFDGKIGIYLRKFDQSPLGNYVIVVESGWEYSLPLIYNIQTGSNVISDNDIWLTNLQEDLLWLANDGAIIHNYRNDLTGDGYEGLLHMRKNTSGIEVVTDIYKAPDEYDSPVYDVHFDVIALTEKGNLEFVYSVRKENRSVDYKQFEYSLDPNTTNPLTIVSPR